MPGLPASIPGRGGFADRCPDGTTAADALIAVGRLSGEYVPGPFFTLESLPVADAPREEIDSRFSAIITDVIGTPTALMDPQGGVAWRGVATLWGTTVWSTADTAYTPLRFVGQYHDAESGLHYNVHRYYDPETAQHASPDPLGLSAGPNPVSYVHNPLRAADPLGLNELPLGEKGNPFATRQDAERAAYDLGGIPHDEQPMAQWSMGADVTRRGSPNYVYDTNETHWGEMRQYETENGSGVIVEHTHDPAGSHFHVGRAKPDGTGEPRNFVNFGWNGQDPVKDEFERYLEPTSLAATTISSTAAV
jgi:RHS repeat-associated protein